MSDASLTFSIILCTFERTSELLDTLDSIRRTALPGGMSGELIVVDNSRTDHTRQVLETQFAAILGLPLRVLHETHRGKVHALNRGIAAAHGNVLLFTDNDVHVPSDWIEPMIRPILAGEADAVAGGVHLAPELCRSWMEPVHRGWMASTEVLNPERPEALIGANMAVGRRVFARVPLFDPELGPGSAIGSGEETLFSFQLRAAGFHLKSAFHVSVEHRFDPARLARGSFLDRARIEGSAGAYVAHHWAHETESAPRRALFIVWCKLWLKRWFMRPRWTSAEGAPWWELRPLIRLHFLRQYLRERHRPRNYALKGLVKVPPVSSP